MWRGEICCERNWEWRMTLGCVFAATACESEPKNSDEAKPNISAQAMTEAAASVKTHRRCIMCDLRIARTITKERFSLLRRSITSAALANRIFA
jgi:hypothetical protein